MLEPFTKIALDKRISHCYQLLSSTETECQDGYNFCDQSCIADMDGDCVSDEEVSIQRLEDTVSW